MNNGFVITGAVVLAIGLVGFSVGLYPSEQEQIRSVFHNYFPIWIMTALAGLPILVSGFVRKFHIVFALLSSFALVLIWLQTVRYN